MPPDDRKPTSTDSRGVGQSGYTAGRKEPDPALARQAQPRNANYPRPPEDDDAHDDATVRDDLKTDDRFTGRGGSVPPLPDRDKP